MLSYKTENKRKIETDSITSVQSVGSVELPLLKTDYIQKEGQTSDTKMSQGSWGVGPKGVGGFSSLYKDSRKKVTASSENYRCQKCLEVGHFTYECKGERKYVAKTSRTVMLKRRMEGDTKGVAKQGKQKKVEDSSSSGKFVSLTNCMILPNVFPSR